jgi:hypothetical protein
MGMSVKCECGKELPVSPGQAGTDVTCSCGNTFQAPLLSELRRRAREPDDRSRLATALAEMMDDDPAPQPTASLFARAVKILVGLFLVVVLIGLVQIIVGYEARRLGIGRPTAPSRRQTEAGHGVSDADQARLDEFSRIYAESKEESWDVIDPLHAYDAGEIDARALVAATTKPADSLLKKYTRMMEIARSLEQGMDEREARIQLSSKVLLRHRGITMMIEGIGQYDPAKVEAGRRLFEDARNQILELSIDNLPEDSEESKMLRRLLDAYRAE